MTFWSHLKINLFTFLASAAGLCSNAFASANANAAFALALAFDCPAADAFALAFAFDSSAFALAFDSNAFDWNQMRNKCETNSNQMRLCYCYIMFIFLVGFAWNRSQDDQYKNLLLQCLRLTAVNPVHTKTEANPCVNGFLV